MTARLARAGDEDHIIKCAATIGQAYGREWATEMIKAADIITVVDPPRGLFWVRRGQTRGLVIGGPDIADDDGQLLDLYKTALTEALSRWPDATTLECHIGADCQPDAVRRARDLIGMTAAAANVYRISRADLTAVLK